MENRQNNIVAIVQARMGSSRLPGKVAKKIMGQPMLAHLIDRLKYSNLIDQIVVATSILQVDDMVAQIAQQAGIGVYRGSESNVLSRYLEAAQEFNADIIIRITGDCPLIDPGTVDKAINIFLEKNVNYLRLDVAENGYPRGLDTEVFYYNTLVQTVKYIEQEGYAKDSPYCEHVTLYIYNHPEKFKVIQQKPDESLQRNYRLCVDEPADFQLISQIYERLYKKGEIIAINQVIELLDNDLELAMINQGIKQKKV